MPDHKKLNKKPHTKLLLLLTFLKIGAFTFGGGYAMIPLITREVVQRRKWITDADLLEIVAIAESTPGPIAINAATFVGYKIAGFWGAALATFGVVLPSFLIILLVSFLMEAFQHLKVIRYAFFGIRAGVLALILKALYSMFRQCPKDIISLLIAAAAFILVALVHVNVILVILGCALVGLLTSFLCKKRKEETK